MQDSEDNYRVALSPDRYWMLYVESAPTKANVLYPPKRLMRRPAAGGSPERVLKEPSGMDWDYQCPSKLGSPCVLGQREGKEHVFYSLDPVRGKGEGLGRIETSDGYVGWCLSPDGSQLALVDGGEEKYKGRILLLALGSRAWRELRLEPGWGDLQSIGWAADGKGFFISYWAPPDSYNLLHVTLDGKVKLLLPDGHRSWITDPLPSPDGKYLAFQGHTVDSNVWVLENF